MAYTTQLELIAAYRREVIRDLTDRTDPPTGSINNANLQAAIDAAVELADGYLSKKYRLPLDLETVDLKRHVRAIAFFNLHSDRPEMITDAVRIARDDAEKWLMKISTAEILLPDAIKQSDTGTIQATYSPRIFSATTLQGY